MTETATTAAPTESAMAPAAESPAPASAPAPAETAPAPAATADWRAQITDPKLREAAGRFADPGAAVKAVQDLRGKLSNAIIKPGKDASAEDVAAFHRALGVPDKPDGYEITLPADLPPTLAPNDASNAALNAFKSRMHAAGAPPAVVQEAVKWYYETSAAAVTEADRVASAATEAAMADIRKSWGSDFERNVQYAKQAATTFGDAGFQEFIKTAEVGGVQLGNHPAFLRVFAEIGRRLGEDGFHGGAATDDGLRQTLQGQIDDLTAKMYSETDQNKRRAIDRQLQALYEKLHGSGPIVGREARAT